MQFLRGCSVMALALGVLATGGNAWATFTPPADLSPYKPINNQAVVTKVSSTGGQDFYKVYPGGNTISVPGGTSVAKVQKTASLQLAYKKYYNNVCKPYLTQGDMADLMAAKDWFWKNIAPWYN